MTLELPLELHRTGLVLARSTIGAGTEVVGDPCVVWDEAAHTWRMFLFVQPGGHGHAVCAPGDDPAAGVWSYEGALQIQNPQDVVGGTTHKPFVVMDAHRPNHAARIEGRYHLVSVSFQESQKVVQGAWAEQLAGPWTFEPEVLIDVGGPGEFDERHVDAVSGFFFPERGEVLYFYMGYPKRPQTHPLSPYGSAVGAAVRRIGERHVNKLGVVLAPACVVGHWASGWAGGVQLLPGRQHQWVALVNASPSAPNPSLENIWSEEPPPSLGGFAVCDAEWPVQGWEWCDEPIEHIEDLPPEALAHGEGVNLWRQHLLLQTGRDAVLLYNSGAYGQEQVYSKRALI